MANAEIFTRAGCTTGAKRNTTDPEWITAFYNATLGPGSALKMMNFVSRMMNFVLKMMNFVFKMVMFALKGLGSLAVVSLEWRWRRSVFIHFLLKNPDFLLKNVDFLLKTVDLII